MSRPKSEHRELAEIVEDLWKTMLPEPGDIGDRRVASTRAQEGGHRAADQYLTELVDALGLEKTPGDHLSFNYFRLHYDPAGGWRATLSRFFRPGRDVRADLAARAAEVSTELRARTEQLRAPESASQDHRGDETAERRDREHAEREARAKAALDRARRAIARIDRIKV